MIRTTLLLLMLISAYYSFGQKKEIEDDGLPYSDTEWSEGSILLTDGTELNGLIRFEDQNGVLSFQDGTNSRALTAQRVSGFEFFDESIQHQRVFYTFPFKDSKTKIVRPQFFEVVRDYQSFAVLSKIDRLDIREKFNPQGPTFDEKGNVNLNDASSPTIVPTFNDPKIVISQIETFYVIDSEGTINPYVQFKTQNDGEFNLLNRKDTKILTKWLDEEALEKFIGLQDFSRLRVYANTNKLNWERKTDLIKILEYYDTIR